MARQPRLALAGHAHYVVQQAVHDQALVRDDTDRRALVNALTAAAGEQRVTIWAYALTDQALHLLARPGNEHALGAMMQSLGRRYVVGYNRRHARGGALWAGRFAAAVVEPGAWLLAAIATIDGLLEPDSPWSSAAHHCGGQPDSLLADPPEIWGLGNTPFEREGRYAALLRRGVGQAQRDQLARAARGGWAVGSPEFLVTVSEQAGRPVRPRRRGRPPKLRPPTPTET